MLCIMSLFEYNLVYHPIDTIGHNLVKSNQIDKNNYHRKYSLYAFDRKFLYTICYAEQCLLFTRSVTIVSDNLLV